MSADDKDLNGLIHNVKSNCTALLEATKDLADESLTERRKIIGLMKSVIQDVATRLATYEGVLDRKIERPSGGGAGGGSGAR